VTLRFVVGAGEAGERLDRALSDLAGVPRAQVRRWIDDGRVRLGGKIVRASRAVVEGDELEAEPPEVRRGPW